MKYLVLGNGASGSTAAVKLRELDSEAQIVVVSAEDVPAYSKIMLPDYVGGKIEKEKLFLRDKDFYQKINIGFLGGMNVIEIYDDKKEILFENGHVETYDKLLLAMGSVPFVPPIKGLSKVEYFTINSIHDSEVIISNVIPSKTAVIVGGGLTGIEMGFALGRLGMKVFIIEKEQNILPQQLDADGAYVMEKELLKHSVKVIAACGVEEFSENEIEDLSEEKYFAHLEDGRKISCSLIIIAIGTRPNLNSIRKTQIIFGRGVLTNEYMKTNVENIFAAGDIAETVDAASNGYVSAYIWPNAMAQGKCAAFNMVGQSQIFSFEALKYNMVQLRDMAFVCMGMVKPPKSCDQQLKQDQQEELISQSKEYELITVFEADNGIYKRLVLRDNIIVGMTLIGDIKNANMLASLIRKKTNVEGVNIWDFMNK
jgi:nitrite reductase (NADH) large subunit